MTQTGFYSSNDNGNTWSKVNIPSSQGESFRSFSHTGSSFIIVGSNFPAETYVSNDFGNSWHEITTPNTSLVNAYTNGKYYFDIALGGNYISIDAGQTWNILGDIGTYTLPHLLFSSNSSIAFSDQGSSYSDSSGLMGSWTSLNSQIPSLSSFFDDIGVGNYVIYSVQNYQGLYENFISYDRGVNWNKLTALPRFCRNGKH